MFTTSKKDLEMIEWIKYEDRRPEDEQDCWLCQHDETISRANYYQYHEIYGTGFGNYDEFIKEKYVKYWMSYFTPEPPFADETLNGYHG